MIHGSYEPPRRQEKQNNNEKHLIRQARQGLQENDNEAADKRR
jgi:hypothetical protein